MRKKLAILAAIALAVGLGAVLLLGPRGAAPPPGPAGEDGEPASGAPPGEPDTRVPPEPGAPAPAEFDTGLAGRVVDESGRGVPGAAVRVVSAEPGDGREAVRATTDGEGRYRVAVAPAAMPYDVFARARGFAPGTPRRATVSDGRVAEVPDLVLRPGGTVSGRVLGPGNAPVEGAEVSYGLVSEIFFFAESVPDASTARTGPDGSFTLRDLPAGTLEVRVRASGFANAVLPSVSLEETVEKEGIVVRLVPEAALLVRVVSDEGVPLEEAEIGVFAAATKHDVDALGDGVFVVHGLEPGGAWLTVSCRGHSKEQVSGVAGGPRLTITLRRLAEVRVAVVDAETGAPLAPAGLVGEKGVFGDTEELGPGRHLVRGLEWGENRIHANVPGYGVTPSETLVLVKGGPLPEVTIRAARLPAVSGRVVDGAGNPVTGAWVDLAEPGKVPEVAEMLGFLYTGFAMTIRPPTDREGRFRLAAHRPGTYAVYARADGFPVVEGPTVTVGNEDVGDVEVALLAGGTVEGIAPEGTTVTAVHRSGRFAVTVPVDRGLFRIAGVPPGETLVTWRHKGAGTGMLRTAKAFAAGKDPGDPRAVVLTVPGGAVVRCDFGGEEPGRVHVRFTRGGKPAVGLDVPLWMLFPGEGRYPERSYAGRTRTDENGEVTFADLEPGDYQVTGARGATPVWFRVVTVKPAETVELLARIASGSFTATVVDDATGAPVEGASLTAPFWADEDGRRIAKMYILPGGLADERGAVTVADLPPGRYRLGVRAKGYRKPDPVVVAVRAGETTHLDPIRLVKE